MQYGISTFRLKDELLLNQPIDNIHQDLPADVFQYAVFRYSVQFCALDLLAVGTAQNISQNTDTKVTGGVLQKVSGKNLDLTVHGHGRLRTA